MTYLVLFLRSKIFIDAVSFHFAWKKIENMFEAAKFQNQDAKKQIQIDCLSILRDITDRSFDFQFWIIRRIF